MQNPQTVAELTAQLKAEALRLGFSAAACTPAATPGGLDRFHAWLDQGYAGTMEYLPRRREAYAHPQAVLEGVRSLLVLAMNYRTVEPKPPASGEGRISRYAWGTDYHDLIHDRLKQLARWLTQQRPEARARGVVDSAPLLEREFAQLAGLGWIGKNTLVLNRQLGSWFFLAALLTDLELEYDEPFATDHCGTCRACLDACPTDAFVAPYVLDATRCISYLTIELREPIPADLRSGMGDWVFGCDVCQDVCPWNRKAPATNEPELLPSEGNNPLELATLFELDDEAFRKRFRHTPLWRAKRRGLLRNAAIVLGNTCDPRFLGPLVRGLHDSEPFVRGACAWALGRLATPEAHDALLQRRPPETDPQVLEEIEQAIG